MTDIKQVMIEITESQSSGNGQKDGKTNVKLTGTLEQSDNGIKLVYDEVDADGNLYTVKVLTNGNTITVDRNDFNRGGQLIIEKDQRNTMICHVGPPELMMDFIVGVYGTYVEIDDSDENIIISAGYTVDVDSCYTSSNELKIIIKEL